jgi:hypothetical protein
MFFSSTLLGTAFGYSLTALFTPRSPAVSIAASGDTTSAGDTARATSPIDTGDFVPGHITFTRYTTPQLCIGAVRNTQWLAQRSIDAQIAEQRLQRTHGRVTLPASAIDVAQRCLAAVPVAETAPGDLPDLLQLTLAANQDSVATHVVERQLALASTAVGRDSVLLSAISIYLAAEPTRLTEAAAFVDQVAESGEAGKRWQLRALDTLLNAATQIWDHPAMTRFANRMIDHIRTFPPAHRANLTIPMRQAFEALGMVAYLQGPDSLRAVAARKRALWHTFVPPFDSAAKLDMAWDLAQSAPVDAYVKTVSPVAGLEGAATSVYPAVHTPYWFPKQPPSGTTRLFISGEGQGLEGLQRGCAFEDLALLYRGAEDCYPVYERIRDLAARYGPRGLQIVLVVATHGRAARSLPLAPAEEAQRLKWYFLEYLKLPVTLAVIERPVGKLPAPDGRQWWRPICDPNLPESDMSEIACKYLKKPYVLLDRHGKQVPLWGPEAQQDTIIEQQVSQ